MPAALIDENLPRRFGEVLLKHGFDSLDVRDHGMRGAADDIVFDFCRDQRAVLVTSDLEFAQRIHLWEQHFGVFLIRLPTALSVNARCDELDRALTHIQNQSLKNTLFVISAGAVRSHGKTI